MAVASRLTEASTPTQTGSPWSATMGCSSAHSHAEASTNLYEIIKSGNLLAYADNALRLAIHRAVAIETSRGWKISKQKVSHKIDVVIALAMAALGAVQGGQVAGPGVIAAANLSPSITRTNVAIDPDNEAAGYAAEQARWRREAMRRELLGEAAGPLLDSPGCYGSRDRFPW